MGSPLQSSRHYCEVPSATEAVTEAIARLRELDARTNCVAAWNDDALARAAELDRSEPTGALHGVPITVKDWIDVAGLPCTGGMEECRDRVPARDATVVSRVNEAGAIVIAKTTVQVDSPLFGPVRNPHDPTRSPGASSSGEAVAVGGGASPLGLASDSGGSIRLPAAWCGAVGLKPTFGRVPTTGHFPRVGERSDGRTQIGPIARSVRGAATALAVIAGPDGRDAGTPPVALGAPGDVRIEGLRVAWNLGDDAWRPARAIRDAVERCVQQLGDAGATLTRETSFELDASFDITKRYWSRVRGALPADDADRHLVDWDRYRARMLKAHADIDVVIMPTTADVAPSHQPVREEDYIFTLPASLTGAPAAALPVHTNSAMPIAVQIVGRQWRDDVVLCVAALLEGA
jgi:amidase